MNDTIKTILTSIGIGLVILLAIVFLSEKTFGDLTDKDSYKPLWYIIPAFIAVIGFLIYKSKKV